MRKLKDWIIYQLGGVPQKYHKEKLAEERKAADKRVASAEEHFSEKVKLIDSTPADCSRGAWCRSCEFAVKDFAGGYGLHISEVVYCTKGERCKHYKEAK